nr:zinc finger BED domain-containing protein RICESLEEPER 2-like [Ipomoea batatas]
MPHPHSGFELSKKVYDCLVDWGIDRKVFSITLDNASASDVMNSTYVMLDSAIRYRRGFCSLELQDRNYKCCPSDEEWSRGEKMCAFLYPFYAITNLIFGSSYPTSNLYFLQVWKIECLLVENLESEDRVKSDMAMNMKLKFNKYWDDYSVILAIGVILDQRLKLQFVEYCYKKLNPLTCQVKIEGIKKKLYMLYDEYKKTSGDSSSSRVSTPQSQVYSATSSVGVGRGGLGSMGGPGILYQNLISDYVDYRYRSQGESSSGDTKSNLDKYLEDDQLNQLDDIDVRLAKMACDVLSIPITSVASESAFSIGAHILNKYRNRFLPKKVQALICTRETSELDLYLEAKRSSFDDDLDVLSWWRTEGKKYPTLSKVAKDLLAIPVSTVTSKSVFSTSGATHTGFILGFETKGKEFFKVCLGIQFIIRSPLRHASSLPSSTLSNAQASPQQYDQTCNACRFYGIYMCFFKPTVDLKLGHGGSHSGYWDIALRKVCDAEMGYCMPSDWLRPGDDRSGLRSCSSFVFARRTVPGSDGRISETMISKIVSKIDRVPVCNKS